jgi:pepF/M3 family oligoendopeptidase
VTTANAAGALPTWDTSDVFPTLDGREFATALERAGALVHRAGVLFDELEISSGVTGPVGPSHGAAADQAIAALNRAMDEVRTVRTAVRAVVTTDARDEHAQALATEIATLDAALQPLNARLAGWVAALGADALAEFSPTAAEHAGPLTRLAHRAAHQMPDSHEALYAELRVDGSQAWARLHADVTSHLTADVVRGSTHERLPIAAVRGLASDPDPAVRRAAYEAELRHWPEVATVCAAALNAIKGEAIVVGRRRQWPAALEAALFANNVSRAMFDAMQSAVCRALPDFQRWMRRKAEGHNHRGPLPWWDLVAPLPGAAGAAQSGVGWSDGIELVKGAFGEYSRDLAALVDRAVTQRWIDAGPRTGKRGGAFCTGFVADRSLILLNWTGSLNSVQTLAHELGHAFHNTRLAPRTALQRQLPMALAETASIFCETLMVESALHTATDPQRRLAVLDLDLQNATQIVVDIHSRFLFEQDVFERRSRRSLGVTELCSLMTDAQQRAYGDGLDQSTAHPWMWAVKPHYYNAHFYNWPYTYGLLFGLGLYARYRVDPERFRAGYDELLSRCGMDGAGALAASFDLDVTDESFWESSLDVLRERMASYEQLMAAARGAGAATVISAR